MKIVNVTRLALCGILAGAVIFVIEGAVNHGLLGDDWKAWMQMASDISHPPSSPAAMILWAIMSLVMGFTGIWIYAGIRPRYGKGPKTAVLAGLLLWLPGWLAQAIDQTAMGIIPARMIVFNLVGGLVAALLGTLAGAWQYKE